MNRVNVEIKEAILKQRQRDLLHAGESTAALILEMILLNIACRKATIVMNYLTTHPRQHAQRINDLLKLDPLI